VARTSRKLTEVHAALLLKLDLRAVSSCPFQLLCSFLALLEVGNDALFLRDVDMLFRGLNVAIWRW